jgi:5-methylcytosine-specific restriction protein A
MAWEGSTRHDRLPADWPDTRVRILNRDGHRCQHQRVDTGKVCGVMATDVDHIHRGDDHRDENLQALCTWHHRKKSGREGGLASGAARAAKRAREAPSHPGLT